MSATYFDRHAANQATVTATEGNWSLCYRQQIALVDSLIQPGMTVLDVGCGPRLPYHGYGAYVIGLDPSAESLGQNTDVDERIVGSAENIQMIAATVDLAVLFYSLHHITGQTMAESETLRRRAFGELSRVLKPGGQLLVFEMTPTSLGETLQSALWPLAKRALGAALDSLFWAEYEVIAASVHGRRGNLLFQSSQTFDCSSFALIAPIISLPWLKIPRFLFPLTPTLYRWSKP